MVYIPLSLCQLVKTATTGKRTGVSGRIIAGPESPQIVAGVSIPPNSTNSR